MAGGDDYGRWGATASVATGRSRTSSPASWYSGRARTGGPGGQIGVTRDSRYVRRRSGFGSPGGPAARASDCLRRGQYEGVASYDVNPDAVQWARELISKRRYVLDS